MRKTVPWSLTGSTKEQSVEQTHLLTKQCMPVQRYHINSIGSSTQFWSFSRSISTVFVFFSRLYHFTQPWLSKHQRCRKANGSSPASWKIFDSILNHELTRLTWFSQYSKPLSKAAQTRTATSSSPAVLTSPPLLNCSFFPIHHLLSCVSTDF